MTPLALIPLAAALALIAYQGWASYRIYRGAPQRRARDVSAERRPLPAALVQWADSLIALGFRRLGEIELELPAVGALQSIIGRGSERHTAWIFVDAAGTSSASVVEGMVELSSQLADASFVETMYPVGHNASLPGLELRHVTSSVADAYRTHVTLLFSRQGLGGDARDVSNMSAFLRQDAEFRERHAHAVLSRPYVRSALLPLVAAAALLGLMFATTLLGRLD